MGEQIKYYRRYHGYDYSRGAALFITVATEPRRALFGRVADAALALRSMTKSPLLQRAAKAGRYIGGRTGRFLRRAALANQDGVCGAALANQDLAPMKPKGEANAGDARHGNIADVDWLNPSLPGAAKRRSPPNGLNDFPTFASHP